MGYDMTWLAEIGLDTQTGLDYTGGEEKYISALQRFCKNYDKNRTRAVEAFSGEDFEDYMITVHALKSNTKMIGALELSGDFEKLEMAVREKDLTFVREKHAPAMTAYAELVEKLKPVAELGEVHAADEISAEVARQTAEQLLDALDEFDDDLSKELVRKLSGYPFRITQKDKLKEAETYIDDFMYDEAAEIIREISPAIE
jgi:HPt (histidine-containing phosphotransfer) domain-containing protein